MEVCTAVRQGVPVLPVRLSGTDIRQLDLPIWEAKAHPTNVASSSPTPEETRTDDRLVPAQLGQERPSGRSENGSVSNRADGDRRPLASRRRELDKFYAQLSRGLPKATQEELHRNRFLVKDVIAAVRSCFNAAGFDTDGEELLVDMANNTVMERRDSVGEVQVLDAKIANEEMAVDSAGRGGKSDSEVKPKAATKTKTVDALLAPPPRTFNPAMVSGHQALLESVVGITRDTNGDATPKLRQSHGAAWNWERLPQTAEQAGRMRGTEAVPWRPDEDMSELIKQEQAEAVDLAGEPGTGGN